MDSVCLEGVTEVLWVFLFSGVPSTRNTRSFVRLDTGVPDEDLEFTSIREV